MKYIIGLLAMLLPLCSGAQSPPIKALTIGDMIPQMPSGIIINYFKPDAKLSDFKNDLVILDFWTTWCAPCIKALSEFQELQNKFGSRIQFVLSTPEVENKIEKFLYEKNISLPCFAEQKDLDKFFPHNSVPHEVWIKNGKVAAITYSESVTAENIQKILEGGEINLPEKKYNPDYDISSPLLTAPDGSGGNDLLYHSVITRYLDGMSGSGVLTDSLGRFRIRVINADIGWLYRTSVKQQDLSFLLDNRMMIEATEKGRLIHADHPEYNVAIRPDFYCYELIVPSADKENAGAYMMQDLNRYFGAAYHIKGAVEKRKVLCWVMRRSDGEILIHAKKRTAEVIEKDGYEEWENQPFDAYFYALAFINRKQPHPFVNKTGIKGNVDIGLPLTLKDIPALQSYLSKYRLKLSLEESEISMLVIKNIH